MSSLSVTLRLSNEGYVDLNLVITERKGKQMRSKDDI
jgi:hypothetical protein